MRLTLAASLCVLVILGVAGCAASARDVQGSRVAHVYVTVDGWKGARVGAWLVNGSGQRTGWEKGRLLRGIPGLMHEFGSEEEPEGGNDDDSSSGTRPAQEYVIPDESGVTPMHHYFTVEDSADAPSLLRKGGCELRLDPVIGGEVRLMLVADAAGSNICRDTTSIWVTPGVPARWKLSWSAVDSTCRVKFTRITEKNAGARVR